MPHITTQHGYKIKHSTDTALHNINNTIATVFNQNQLPVLILTIALDIRKAFDSVNIPKPINKRIHILHINIPNTITKIIANIIK